MAADASEAAQGQLSPAQEVIEWPEAFDAISCPKKRAFLEARSLGMTKLNAAARAGVNVATPWNWGKQGDDAYNKAAEIAEAAQLAAAEDELRRRAVDGILEPVFYKGEQVATVRRHSDVLLIFMLKAAAPDKYRDNVHVTAEHNVKAYAGFDPSEV
tara:strand:- start:429 stop:899 length:471 start_codon:yes stop_codon:yes gene_type:complete